MFECCGQEPAIRIRGSGGGGRGCHPASGASGGRVRGSAGRPRVLFGFGRRGRGRRVPARPQRQQPVVRAPSRTVHARRLSLHRLRPRRSGPVDACGLDEWRPARGARAAHGSSARRALSSRRRGRGRRGGARARARPSAARRERHDREQHRQRAGSRLSRAGPADAAARVRSVAARAARAWTVLPRREPRGCAALARAIDERSTTPTRCGASKPRPCPSRLPRSASFAYRLCF